MNALAQGFRALLGTCLAVAAIGVHAQDFPAGASVPSEAQVKNYLGDHVFHVDLADGKSWRLEYKTNGYYFFNTSTGASGSGKWQAEDGKLCGQAQGRDRTCSDVRLFQDLLYYKRDSGEVIRLVPR